MKKLHWLPSKDRDTLPALETGILLVVFIVIIALCSCTKQLDSPIGNTLFNWRLTSYRGPDTDWKTVQAKDVPALQDDGIRFTAHLVTAPNPYGGTMWVNQYSGTIYQGSRKYWPTKPDLTFSTVYINDTTFQLGTLPNVNIAYFNGAGETLRIAEKSPVWGREYWYEKVSD